MQMPKGWIECELSPNGGAIYFNAREIEWCTPFGDKACEVRTQSARFLVVGTAADLLERISVALEGPQSPVTIVQLPDNGRG